MLILLAGMGIMSPFLPRPYRLYWYKSPSDLDSLGDVDVLAAAFEVVVEDPKNLTTFKIK